MRRKPEPLPKLEPMELDMENPVVRYLALAIAKCEQGFTPKGAAMTLSVQCRPLCLDVIETIGAWPSSDPYLRELQRVFP